MSMITKVILNINLYSPKISISTVFLFVLLLSLDPQTLSAFPEVKYFSHHLSLVLCELIFSSKTLIPIALLICLLTTSTSCYYYSNTWACKNWAWWENLRTVEDRAECEGGDAEATCRMRDCLPVCDRRRGCAEWFMWEICHGHTENKTTSAQILVFVVRRNAFSFLLGSLWSI